MLRHSGFCKMSFLASDTRPKKLGRLPSEFDDILHRAHNTKGIPSLQPKPKPYPSKTPNIEALPAGLSPLALPQPFGPAPFRELHVACSRDWCLGTGVEASQMRLSQVGSFISPLYPCYCAAAMYPGVGYQSLRPASSPMLSILKPEPRSPEPLDSKFVTTSCSIMFDQGNVSVCV